MKKIYFFAILFALITAMTVYLFAASIEKKGAASAKNTVSVVTAVSDVAENTVLTKDMIKIIQLPQGTKTIAATSADEVVGKVTRYPLLAGEEIVAAKLGELGNMDSGGLTYMIKEGSRAVAIQVDEVSGVSGYLQANDSVDVIETVEDKSSGTSGNFISVCLLKNIKVLSVGLNGSDPKKGSYSSVVLQVTPDDAVKLNYATTMGKIRLALRPVTDSASASPTPVRKLGG